MQANARNYLKSMKKNNKTDRDASLRSKKNLEGLSTGFSVEQMIKELGD